MKEPEAKLGPVETIFYGGSAALAVGVAVTFVMVFVVEAPVAEAFSEGGTNMFTMIGLVLGSMAVAAVGAVFATTKLMRSGARAVYDAAAASDDVAELEEMARMDAAAEAAQAARGE